MKVLLTGGGTGGHITPLLAVAQELKRLDPKTQVIYVGERHSKFASMTKDQTVFDQHFKIFAGKFRRYHGESWFRRLTDPKTNLLNFRDLFYVLVGIIQAWFLLRRIEPDVIFLKGGYVGVPIGIAAGHRFGLVTHDSDALPGLANRLVGDRATIHAVALEPKVYSYPPNKTQQTGVIVSADYRLVTPELRARYQSELEVPVGSQVLTITGGSLGSRSINQAMVKIMPQLLKDYPKLWIFHQVGNKHRDIYGQFSDQRLVVMGLFKHLERYLGAADVVITRAGASTLAELGIQGKATIVVPNPLLTGGHQLKNTQELARAQAVMVVNESSLREEQGGALDLAIRQLLDDPKMRVALGRRFHKLTIADGTRRLAKLLTDVAAGRGTK
jgi:UDP-N-acetylglucosamine--N-acetylmuramyl-(pentapeptide) pyrophosphoryl-undecaprenol N-acetylglucosamine transferase